MKKIKISVIVGLTVIIGGLMVAVLGCSSGTADSASPVKATWINAEVRDNTVLISKTEIENGTIIHFSLETGEGKIASMAYTYGKSVYVRSNICPPCRSIGFSLEGDDLVCDSCGTRFSAASGKGIRGACVNYPKASIPYQSGVNSLEMKAADIVTAYNNTVKPGLP